MTPEVVWLGLLGIVNLVFLVDLYVDYRQHRCISKEKRPKELAAICTEEEYSRSRLYNVDCSQFAMLAKIIQHFLGVAMLFAGFYPHLWTTCSKLFVGEIKTSMAFQAAMLLIGTISSLPFSIYKTFILEKRHGFNRTTLGTFIGDLIKELIINTSMGAIVVGSIVWIVRTMSNYFAPAVCIFLLIFQIVMVLIYPTLIQPLFNKFTPLGDGELKTKIEKLATKVKFPLTKIFAMDGSKRSSHSNAYFFGFFRNKRIVLYDTIIEQLDPDEVTAIVGHELGHWANNDMLKGLAMVQANILAMFYLFQLVMNYQPLYLAFGFKARPVIIGLTLFEQLLSPASFALSAINNYFTRAREFAADRYSVDAGYGAFLPKALTKTYKENKNLVYPDWLYSTIHYSHPPPSERLAAISFYSKRKD